MKRIALRDLEMSRDEAAKAHAANAQADRRAEVLRSSETRMGELGENEIEN